MPEFELTLGADRDLDEIARYTTTTWGAAQTRRYMASIERHLKALARQEVRVLSPLPRREEVQSSLCEHHYVISVLREDAPLLIVALLHENMDLPVRLRERLRDEGLNG